METLNDPGQEREFTESMLIEDTKNYHAWQHRQWLVEHFNLFGVEELNFSTGCLADDLRNNSAWNYRYFILSALSGGFTNAEWVEKEVK